MEASVLVHSLVVGSSAYGAYIESHLRTHFMLRAKFIPGEAASIDSANHVWKFMLQPGFPDQEDFVP